MYLVSSDIRGSCSGGVSGRVSQLCADSAERPGFLEHPGITGPAPERAASPPYRSTRGVIYLWMALRGEIPAPAMIIQPGEGATHPHTTGRVPHPPGDAIPHIPTQTRIPPLTLAEQPRTEPDNHRQNPDAAWWGFVRHGSP